MFDDGSASEQRDPSWCCSSANGGSSSSTLEEAIRAMARGDDDVLDVVADKEYWR